MNGKVTFFDQFNPESWGFSAIEDIMLQLDYGSCPPNLKVYWLLPGKDLSDGLRIVASDKETEVMNSVAKKVQNFVLYFDHHNHVGGQVLDDVVMNTPECKKRANLNANREPESSRHNAREELETLRAASSRHQA